MTLQIGLIILGLALILAGAEFLTNGAASIAERFRIPEIIIGLTIVAFGTSAPELTVSVFGSLSNNGGIAVGNVIGSNIFNCLAILGLTAIVTALPVGRNSRRYDIPIAIFAAIVLLTVVSDPWLEGADTPSSISRTESIILVLFGLFFIGYTITVGKKASRNARAEEQASNFFETKKHRHIALDILMIIGGLIGLVIGGRFFVENASLIASALGVSDTLIGLTLVAWGTSLPELATSMVAASKNKVGIAVGNVVGSNIFNIFFVLGIAGTVSPLTGLQFTTLDIFMQLFAIVVTYFAAFGNHKISVGEGTVMLVSFIAYNYIIISNALAI